MQMFANQGEHPAAALAVETECQTHGGKYIVGIEQGFDGSAVEQEERCVLRHRGRGADS
ncbi:hypothetical protein GCM10023144_00300 [Pigmentiphaga soli]|uniref:Uncharacterized protein n=1 Tax=Pigmentiphaga soli TaxID=1007095 RepID=A0ABP8GBM8_9BURK